MTRKGVWAKHDLTGYLLAGKTLGVVGCGSIGARVGELGAKWSMNVLGCVSPGSNRERPFLRAQCIRVTDFEEVLETSDYLSVYVPFNETTRGLIGRSELARMRPGAFLTDLSRGGVVDERALSEALTEGRLRGAATDVHESEVPGRISSLARLDNVILTPHIGSMTVESQREIGKRVLNIVADYEKEVVGR